MDEPVDAPSQEPVDAPSQEPVDAPAREPVDVPPQEPVDGPAQEPVAAEPAAPSPVSPTQPAVPAPTEPEPVTAPVDEPAEAPADAAAPAPARRPPRGARAAFVDVAPSVEHLLRPSDRLRALPEGWIALEGQGLTLGFREPREVEVVRFQLAVEQAQEPVLWLCLLRALDEGGRPGADVTKVDQVTGTAALGVLVSLHVTRPSTVTVCAFPADRKVPARGLEGTTTLAEGPVQLTREARIELTCAREARGRLALSLAQGQRTVWRTTLSPRPELAGATTLHTFLGAYFELQARQRVEISPAAEPRRR
ncbi:MAG: hypothetical protein KF878_37795 [Planctomycetes bacterium]|nr:hypothetical protein [Planctomycetota bacterium]